MFFLLIFHVWKMEDLVYKVLCFLCSSKLHKLLSFRKEEAYGDENFS